MTVNDRNTLFAIALEAGLSTPVDPSTNSWDLHPHFELFCALHLHTKVPNKDAMLANAKLIATIDSDEASRITKSKLLKMGFVETKA
jgi:hypothetical protein